jgi:DNA-binding CsgD family transcriptional regulator
MKKISRASENHAHQLFSTYLENFINFPHCYVFWKNLKGIYLGYNDQGAENLGYDKGSDIYGKTDFDLFPHNIANIFRENDHMVAKEEKQIFFPENGYIKNNTPVIFLSHKMPLYDHNSEVCGVLGFAFVNMTEENRRAEKIIVNDQINSFSAISVENKASNISILSEKEITCIRYLCQGLTCKMIARRMNISPKTVETYFDRAKFKLNCHNKAQLILAFVNLIK